MSFGLPLVECIYCVGCSRWAWKRCTYTGNDDSQNWTVATTEEFETVPRICRLILAVYEEDLRNPKWPPKGGYRINPDWVIKKVSYKVTLGNAPPYLIYLDHDAHDIVLAIRGLNLAKNSDYAVLLDNRSEQMFDGGYVHHGLLRSAVWLHKQEKETLIELTQGNPSYTLTFAGHSLGSGVAALLTMVVAKHPEQLGNISRKRLRCYAVAPARCMSLNLAVKYADVINSVILQDDFLPRTATPLEDIFKSVFCLPCLLCVRCMKDTCLSEERRLQDPKRFYAPGRLYHIVDRKPWRCGRYPPEVRTAIPVRKRFEHIILSCNATQDHAIIWIEKEAQKAVDRMMEKEKPMEIPPEQRMERKQSIVKGHEEEHKTALERAQSLNIPHAYSPPHSDKNGNNSEKPLVRNDRLPSSSEITESSAKNEVQAQRTDWDDLLKRLFEKDAGGKLVLKEGSP